MPLHHTSCHCGAVRCEVIADLATETLRCNCSYCLKVRSWAIKIAPEAFRLVQGAEALSQYRFGACKEQHHFCQRCGVRMFSRGVSPTRGAFYAVSVNTFDDVDATTLAAAPVSYIDGRQDRWDAPPDINTHL
jgi:hypothetical protein